MKHKTSELSGALLDAAVAKADAPGLDAAIPVILGGNPFGYSPSTDWAQGGPLIERECIELRNHGFGDWEARIPGGSGAFAGPTPLIAAMLAFVESKLGDEVDL